jgi:hypothetical protein
MRPPTLKAFISKPLKARESRPRKSLGPNGAAACFRQTAPRREATGEIADEGPPVKRSAECRAEFSRLKF